MSHARSVVAGVLAAGIIIVIVQRDLTEEGFKVTVLGIVVIALLLVPEVASYIKHRKD